MAQHNSATESTQINSKISKSRKERRKQVNDSSIKKNASKPNTDYSPSQNVPIQQINRHKPSFSPKSRKLQGSESKKAKIKEYIKEQMAQFVCTKNPKSPIKL